MNLNFLKYLFPIVIGCWIILWLPESSFAQQHKTRESVYRVQKKWEIPLTLGLFTTNFLGLQYVGQLPGLDSMEVTRLDAGNIWNPDRNATRQDADYIEQAQKISDWALNISVALPALLGLDREIRQDWLDLVTLYGETHAINGNLYIISASLVDRPRPLVYNPDLPFSDRTETGTQNSFFSGHVSTAAASSFFAAKVYSDYHPELGPKKYVLFGAAMVPPLVVGFYRVKAMKHFPTDVFTGLIVGALSGILIPHFHKRKKMKQFTMVPFSGKYSGCSMVYRF